MSNPNPPFTAQYVEMTPKRAARLLAINSVNRSLNLHHVSAIASDMLEGRWEDTYKGRAVEIAEDRLIDGQHRLTAVVRTGLTIPMTIVTYSVGVKAADKQIKTDIGGKARTIAQQLKFLGVTSHAAIAALSRVVWVDENDADITGHSWDVSDHEIIEIGYTREQELLSSVRAGQRLTNYTGLIQTAGAWFHWKVMQIDDLTIKADYDEFERRLKELDFNGAEDPIAHLYKRISDLANDPRRSGTSSLRVEQMALTIKAWNAYRLGNPVRVLMWKPGGANPEKFPEPL